MQKKIKEPVNICIKNMAGHDLYIGKFYYKTKHYKGALARFMSVIKNYPDTGGIHSKAVPYIALCRKKLKEQKNNDDVR